MGEAKLAMAVTATLSVSLAKALPTVEAAAVVPTIHAKVPPRVELEVVALPASVEATTMVNKEPTDLVVAAVAARPTLAVEARVAMGVLGSSSSLSPNQSCNRQMGFL